MRVQPLGEQEVVALHDAAGDEAFVGLYLASNEIAYPKLMSRSQMFEHRKPRDTVGWLGSNAVAKPQKGCG